MSRSGFAIIAAALAMVCLLGSRAKAQPAGTDAAPAASESASANAPAAQPDPKTEAKQHFDSGVALFEQEAWDPALAEFERSREFYPTRSATKNAAICLRKLQRFDEAYDMFDRLLHDFPDLPEADKAVAQREQRELKALVGFVQLKGGIPGAHVVIDGRDRGTLPLAPVRAAAGTRLVRVSMEGFLPFEAQVRVAGGETTPIDVQLTALTQGGRLHVGEQNNRAVEVVVDNVVVGKAPWEGTLSVGSHTVWLKGEGNLGTQPAAAVVRLNQSTTLTLAAEPLDATLRVEPTPVGASVAIDGVVVGHGLWDGRVRAGSHRVEVTSEGFVPKSQEVALASNQRRVLGVELERDLTSPMWQARHPARFFVELDGTFALSPSLGGDIVSGCSGACNKTLPVGFSAFGHGGYQLSSGLGFAIDLGYVSLSQKASARSMNLHPQGLADNPGTADDKLALQGVAIGASVQFHRGDSVPIVLRIGAGGLLGSVKDERSGSATTVTRTANGVTYDAKPYTFSSAESPGAAYLYVKPEARVGLRFGEHFEVSAGVDAMILIALGQSKWQDQTPVVLPADYHVGELTFGNQAVAGTTIVVLSPGLGARYEF